MQLNSEIRGEISQTRPKKRGSFMCETLMRSLSRCQRGLFATLRGGNRAAAPRQHLANTWPSGRDREAAHIHTLAFPSLCCVYLVFHCRGQLCGRWWMSSADKHTDIFTPVSSLCVPSLVSWSGGGNKTENFYSINHLMRQRISLGNPKAANVLSDLTSAS